MQDDVDWLLCGAAARERAQLTNVELVQQVLQQVERVRRSRRLIFTGIGVVAILVCVPAVIQLAGLLEDWLQTGSDLWSAKQPQGQNLSFWTLPVLSLLLMGPAGWLLLEDQL